MGLYNPPISSQALCFFFFFNDTATTEIYTLSLHDALPIRLPPIGGRRCSGRRRKTFGWRSEEHTSELQSPVHLVCRLLLEKKNTISVISFRPVISVLRTAGYQKSHRK